MRGSRDDSGYRELGFRIKTGAYPKSTTLAPGHN